MASFTKDAVTYGYLKVQKQSLLGSSSSIYYFVLTRNGKLMRFKTEKDANPADIIDVSARSINAIVDAEGYSGKKFSIAIFITNKSPYIILAQDTNEQKRWLDFLQQALQASKLSEGGSASTPTSASSSAYHSNANSDDAIIQTMEGILDPCVIADANCDIVGWNKAAQNIFGYTREEIIGKNVKELMPDKFGLFHGAFVTKYHKSGQKKLIGMPRTLTGKHKDGSLFAVTLSLGEAPNKSGNESKCAFVAVCRKRDTPVGGDNMSVNSGQSSQHGGNHDNDNASRGSRDSQGSTKIGFLLNAEKNMIEFTELHLGKYMTSLQNEFEDLRKNGELMKHKLKVMEVENRENMQTATHRLNDLKNARLEVAQLRTSAAKFNILEVLRNAETFETFLTFCKERKCSEALHFWKETDQFEKKYGCLNYAEDKSILAEMAEVAEEIKKKFLLNGASMLVNTSQDLINKLQKASSAEGEAGVSSKMFSAIQDDLIHHLNESVYVEFCKSEVGRVAMAIIFCSM